MEQVRRQLEARPDVRAVEVNPMTGSVLVRGDDANGLETALGEVLEIVEAAGPENVQEAGLESAVILFKEVDSRIMRSTRGRMSLRWIVPAGFVAIAVRQLLRNGLTVGELPWFVLLYYGVDSFLKLYPQHAPKPHPPAPAS